MSLYGVEASQMRHCIHIPDYWQYKRGLGKGLVGTVFYSAWGMMPISLSRQEFEPAHEM